MFHKVLFDVIYNITTNKIQRNSFAKKLNFHEQYGLYFSSVADKNKLCHKLRSHKGLFEMLE